MDKRTNLVIVILAIILITVVFYQYKIQRQFIQLNYATKYDPTNLLNSGSLVYRENIGRILEELKAETMIEIGVQYAGHADSVLYNWPSFKAYYGIDPWSKQTNYIDGANKDNIEQDKIYNAAKNALSKYGDRIKLVRELSTKAFKLFDDNSIDFVYVDARHDYCGAMDDLELFYPKLKCNGIMGGHDFITALDQKKWNPADDWSVCADGRIELSHGGAVKGAVIDFMKKYKIEKVAVTTEKYASFYFVKKC